MINSEADEIYYKQHLHLLDVGIKRLPVQESKAEFMFKMIVIGDAGVGKSCLLHRATTGVFSEQHDVSVGVDFSNCVFKAQDTVFKLQMCDSQGQDSFKSLSKIIYRGAECVCLCYDSTRSDQLQSLKERIADVRQ